MTEEESREWIAARFGSAAVDRLAIIVAAVEVESTRQNLISAATMPAIWSRHIVDSAQLVGLAADVAGSWMDIGTGAGFPGLVVAALDARDMVLVEPRRGRVDFLRTVIERLDIERRVAVAPRKVEALTAKVSVISARAVASIEKVLTSANDCATVRTRWLLPKGRHAAEEVAAARRSWNGMFHVEHSITDPTSMIVVASGVSRR